MRSLHLILQGKGGVGKSMVSAILAQQRMAAGQDVLNIDTDPVNKTFAGYSSLKVKKIEIMKGAKLDETAFDRMIMMILNHQGETIIDNGASSFIPLSNYLVENSMIAYLLDNSIDVTVHTIVTGGQALADTLTGFESIAQKFPEHHNFNIVVWLNDYFGEITANGKTFEQFKLYNDYKHRVFGIMRIPKLPQLFELDVRKMQEERMTFEEVLACDDGEMFNILQKRRVQMFQDQMYSQLSVIFGRGFKS